MILTMWINIIDGSNSTPGTNGKLYVKKVETGFVPTPGIDDVVLYKHKEGDDEYDGPIWHVKRRYMDNDGQWHVELSKMILNPNEFWQDLIKRRIATSGSYNYESSWYTGQDGDPIPMLIQGGWVEY